MINYGVPLSNPVAWKSFTLQSQNNFRPVLWLVEIVVGGQKKIQSTTVFMLEVLDLFFFHFLGL